jgi:hypothetical protein
VRFAHASIGVIGGVAASRSFVRSAAKPRCRRIGFFVKDAAEKARLCRADTNI